MPAQAEMLVVFVPGPISQGTLMVTAEKALKLRSCVNILK